MRLLLKISLLLNFVLAAALMFMLYRLGGWNYALHRIQHPEAGIYQHRKQQLEMLPAHPGAIVFLGDSQIREGEWREFFGDSLPILNRGITGDHVEGVLARLPDVLRNRPRKIFLCVGVNDLILGKPQAEIEGRYREIVQRIRREMPEGQVFIQSLLPVNNMVKRCGVANADIDEMNRRLAQIAKDHALPFVNIHDLLQDASGNLAAKFTDDGMHLNGLGYQVWRKEIEHRLN